MRRVTTALAAFIATLSQAAVAGGQRVVVLHGLARSADSMSRMASALEKSGYHVCNVSYPSRKHSLGSIIVRQLAKSETDLHIGRVVMLSPPNHGSEVVDKLGNLSLFELINGPAGLQLATRHGSVPQSLGPATTTARSRSRARSSKAWRTSA